MKKSKEATRSSFGRWWYTFCGRVPIQYKHDYDQYKIETNLRRTLLLSSFIIFIQIFLNILNIVMPHGEGGGDGSDIMKFVYLSLFTLSVGIIYLIISLILRRGHIKNLTFRRVFPFTLLYLYCGIQMVFLLFNVGSDAGMNSYIIALLILGFFLIMPPIQCVISILLLFFIALTIMAFGAPEADAFAAILATDTWANLLIITFLVAAMSYVTYEMFISNFLNRRRLEISNERLDTIAKTDELTGLLNRWGFYERIDTQWTGHMRKPGVIAVYMFDIDFFKDYNDSYGHQAGDDCLRLVARILTRVFSEEREALVCRFGGEEFVVVARADSQEDAIAVADDMRSQILRESVDLPDNTSRNPITLSGGLVTIADSGDRATSEFIALDEHIEKADQALYNAKETGRDRLIIA